MTSRTADTRVPIISELSQRWSPRSFDPDVSITDAQLDALLEAARWAPSASNNQPRRFIVTRRNTPEFDTIVSALAGLKRFMGAHRVGAGGGHRGDVLAGRGWATVRRVRPWPVVGSL
ncbi:nitroreductase family protein [Arthrobacter sp. NicSoilC12]|uniref:nitroreductase family protein n=1 Tax=Arthrobacter sp. NicSoilC12 TaxID=2831001 RepID=UPI0027E496D3|nr:nitroreductase family protein [Arthrobacter sp. NicSoilC12]